MRSYIRSAAFFAALGLANLVLVGCQTVKGGPDRLYSIDEEKLDAREDVLPRALAAYNSAHSDAERMFYRNEYIARRMYVIDVAYTEYETALTRERQEFGFATSVVAQGLSTAGAVFTPVNTVRTLSALSSAVGASKGFYDSDLLLTKTVQIAQGHMRAQRDRVARTILFQKAKSSLDYPISAALHDLEDYYRAGTITAGLIEAVGAAGVEAEIAAKDKAQAQGIPDPAGPPIVVAPLAPNEKIRKPIRSEPQTPNPNFALILDPYNSKTQGPDDVKSIQKALCVPLDEVGVIGPNTKALIRIYEASSPRTAVRNNGKLDADEIDDVLGSGRCANTGPQNFFEKRTFRNNPTGIAALADIVVRLNKVPGTQLAPGASLDDARGKIREVRGVPSISSKLTLKLPDDLADQMTPDLFLALPPK
jgi:hypothetical protein